MANSTTVGVREQTTWSVVLSVLMIVAGVLAIGLPLMTGIAVGAIIAWLLVFSGAFMSHSPRAVTAPLASYGRSFWGSYTAPSAST